MSMIETESSLHLILALQIVTPLITSVILLLAVFSQMYMTRQQLDIHHVPMVTTVDSAVYDGIL